MLERNEKGQFTRLDREEIEERLREDVKAFIDGHEQVHGLYVDTAALRKEDNNLRRRIVDYGRKFHGTASIHQSLGSLGFRSSPYKRLHKDDIETITRETLTEERAREVFKQQGPVDLMELFTKEGGRAKKAAEEITSYSKHYTYKRWERFIDTLHPQLHSDYGLTLSEAARGKPRFTDDRIGRMLYEALTTRQNISSVGLSHFRPYGKELVQALSYKPPRGKAPIRAKFNGKRGFALAKQLPEDFYKNNKEIDLGYTPISKQEVEFMLKVVKAYDPKLQELTALRSIFGKGIAAIHTGKAWTTFKTKNYLFDDPQETDFRVETRDGQQVLVAVDTIDRYVEDKRKLNELGRLPHNVINNYHAESKAYEWLTGEKVDKKIIINSGPPEIVARRGLLMEQETGVKIINSGDLRKQYDKTLEMLLQEEPRFFEAASTNYEYMDKVVSHLKPHFPHIRKWDLIRPGREPEKTLGTIAEEEVKLIFNVAAKHPEATIGPVKDFIPGRILAVYGTSNEEKVSLLSSHNNLKADLRIKTAEGDYLVEVKKISTLNARATHKILEKYAGITHWLDGTPIKGKLLGFNSSTKGLKGDRHQFERQGFKVWNGKEITPAYRQGLQTMLASQPTFLRDIRTPLPGTIEEQLGTLEGVHVDINDYAHIMGRNGNGMYRQWALRLLRDLNDGVSRGARPDRKGRDNIAHIEREYVIPFTTFQALYPQEDLNFTIDDRIVFCDIETGGTNRSGAPVTLIALGYKRGEEMVLHHILSRTPQEEPWALGRYAETVDGKFLAGFNINGFDLPFLEQRFITQGLRPPNIIPMELMGTLKKYIIMKSGNGFPHHKLQTYEQVYMRNTRKSDLKGSKMPVLYGEWLYNGDAQAMVHTLNHGVPDIITMPAMYRDFEHAKILPLPQNYKQATIEF